MFMVFNTQNAHNSVRQMAKWEAALVVITIRRCLCTFLFLQNLNHLGKGFLLAN